MIINNKGGTNSYICELCAEEEVVGLIIPSPPIGWVTIVTKHDDDDHLCPKCWKPIVPKGDEVLCDGVHKEIARLRQLGWYD